MGKRRGESSERGLHNRAERKADPRTMGKREGDDEDLRRLIQELEIHRVELDMQNEELRSNRIELDAALSRYTEIFDFAPLGYFVLTPGGSIRELNFVGARLLGAERVYCVGRRLERFVVRTDREALSAFLAATLAARSTSASCVLSFLGGAEGPVDVRMTASVLQGATPSVLIAAEDVTSQRRAEAALAEEIRHKDDFLAALSHELRNPLAPIHNNLFLLARAAEGRALVRKSYEVIDRQVRHLTRIVDDLLEVTRVARGKVRLERERIEIAGLVHRALDDHRLTFQAAGVELVAQMDEDPCWVEADATRIVQVVGNLLANAVKFTPREGTVCVSTRREGAQVVVAVRDTGIGIAPELLPHLFEPFWQGSQTLDRSRGGLGLGLTMVKGLVELHDGSVGVKSDGAGRGAEFTVRLPIVAAPAVVRETPSGPAPRATRVLVIEDHVDTADSLRDALELEGHEIAVAYDGPTGIALALEFSPEVVICDIGLPGMNGYEVARALRADPHTATTYLVALTGYALPEDRQYAVEAGFDRHVAKPLGISDVERIMADAANRGAHRGTAVA